VRLIGTGYGLGRALAVPVASLAIARGLLAGSIGRWVVGTGPRRLVAAALCAALLLAFALGVGVWGVGGGGWAGTGAFAALYG
jgi:hypothetical protein